MAKNMISASLSDAAVADIKTKIGDIEKQLSFRVNLTPEERQFKLKMGDKSIAFVEKALDLSENNPKLVPPYLDVKEMRKDIGLAKQLASIHRQLASLTESIESTMMVAGSEAFEAALTFYNSAKNASESDVPGTNTIVNELGKRYPGRNINIGDPAKSEILEN